jgi:hypothetical protein
MAEFSTDALNTTGVCQIGVRARAVPEPKLGWVFVSQTSRRLTTGGHRSPG